MIRTGVDRPRAGTVQTYPNRTGLPSSILTNDAPEQLVLITCGGPFDQNTGNYEDNIVVYASPATGS
jgi:hypothetical protein